MKLRKIGETTTVNNYIDVNTGEVIDQDVDIKKDTIVCTGKEDFCLSYASIIGMMKQLNGNDIKVLAYCSIHAEYNTNRISLTKPICQEITNTLDVPYQSIKNSISKLVKKDIITPLGSGTYRIHPQYYWRGDSGNRKKTLKYVLELKTNTN